MKNIEEKCNKVFSILAKSNPNPKTELNYINDFTLLVAIVLSAQATDISVNKATANLFKVVKTPVDMVALGEDNLKTYIKTIGLYNSKAKNLIKLANLLLGKSIPTDLLELEKLPGVGSKTARVFLNCAKNVPIIAVDTHVFRVSKRLGIARGSNAKLVERELNESIPSKWKLNAHHWLILHGRYVCKARNPLCRECLISESCEFYLQSQSN